MWVLENCTLILKLLAIFLALLYQYLIILLYSTNMHNNVQNVWKDKHNVILQTKVQNVEHFWIDLSKKNKVGRFQVPFLYNDVVSNIKNSVLKQYLNWSLIFSSSRAWVGWHASVPQGVSWFCWLKLQNAFNLSCWWKLN